MTFRLFRGTGRFGPMAASAPPYVGRLHGVLAVLPSTRIASVAHAGLMQSFPRHAGVQNRDPLAGYDRGGTHKNAPIRHDASRSGVASKQMSLETCSAPRAGALRRHLLMCGCGLGGRRLGAGRSAGKLRHPMQTERLCGCSRKRAYRERVAAVRLHGVLDVLPSTRIASVAHGELDQSFPKSAPACAACTRESGVPARRGSDSGKGRQ